MLDVIRQKAHVEVIVSKIEENEFTVTLRAVNEEFLDLAKTMIEGIVNKAFANMNQADTAPVVSVSPTPPEIERVPSKDLELI